MNPIFRTLALGATLAGACLPTPVLAQGRPPATGVPTGPGGGDATVFRAPQLDPVTLVMAYHRLSGLTMDFRPLAERTNAYRNASTFDRGEVLTREIARLEGQFAALDLSRVYGMRIGTAIRGYDGNRGGYAIPFDADSFLPMNDPSNYHAYALSFRNIDEVNFIPLSDTGAARNFAQRHAINTSTGPDGNAANAIFEIAIRLAEAPPAVGSGRTPVRADILAARILNQAGQPIWDFGQTTAGRGPAPVTGAPGAGPVLRAADIQGLRLGMPVAEATGIASRLYPTEQSRGVRGRRHFRGMTQPVVENTRCGLDAGRAVDYTSNPAIAAAARLQDVNEPPLVNDASEACIGYDTPAAATGQGASDTVVRVTSGQRLSGVNPEAVRNALIEKYGPPTHNRSEGRLLQWIGRDPARPDGGRVVVTARIDNRRTGGDLVLGVDVAPWPEPAAGPTATPAPAPTGPRL